MCNRYVSFSAMYSFVSPENQILDSRPSLMEKTKLKPGENVWVNANVLITHDVCGPGTIGIFKKEFGHNAKVCKHNCNGRCTIPGSFVGLDYFTPSNQDIS